MLTPAQAAGRPEGKSEALTEALTEAQEDVTSVRLEYEMMHHGPIAAGERCTQPQSVATHQAEMQETGEKDRNTLKL